MAWNKYIIVSFILVLLTSCSISYSTSGGSVNYNIIKTIQISEFPNRTPFYSPMSSMFNLALRKRLVEQTSLTEVKANGDLEIDGEITKFDVQGMAVKQDAYASQTRLTITVSVEYINNKEAGKDVTQTFSAFQEFSSEKSIDEVQDELVKKIIDEIVDMIYNATIASW